MEMVDPDHIGALCQQQNLSLMANAKEIAEERLCRQKGMKRQDARAEVARWFDEKGMEYRLSVAEALLSNSLRLCGQLTAAVEIFTKDMSPDDENMLAELPDLKTQIKLFQTCRLLLAVSINPLLADVLKKKNDLDKARDFEDMMKRMGA